MCDLFLGGLALQWRQMLPVRMEESEDRIYHENLALVRRRILAFVLRRLAPQHADFAQAEDIAQSCVVTLWEKYPDKRELGEMVGIAISATRSLNSAGTATRGRVFQTGRRTFGNFTTRRIRIAGKGFSSKSQPANT